MTSSGSSSPTNLELAKEAGSTRDCERQKELATHPSALVRWHLANNHALCKEALDVIGEDEVGRLRGLTEDDVQDVLSQ